MSIAMRSLLTITLLVSGSQAHSQQGRAPADPYKACVVRKTLSLEPSGADSREVVLAAITACKAVRASLAKLAFEDIKKKNVDLSDEQIEARVARMMAKVDEYMEGDARLKLLEQRAAVRRK